MEKSEIKTLMKAAAGTAADADDRWERGGVERMYFEAANDVNASGVVEVSEGNQSYVRLELFVSPERASEIIQIVLQSRV